MHIEPGISKNSSIEAKNAISEYGAGHTEVFRTVEAIMRILIMSARILREFQSM
jgi:hypothetical protein